MPRLWKFMTVIPIVYCLIIIVIVWLVVVFGSWILQQWKSTIVFQLCIASFYCTCFAVEGLSSRNSGLYSCQVLHHCIVFVLLVFRVLNASAVEIHDYVTTFPAYWFFNGLLFVLQILHLMWTYLILRIAYQKVQTGSVSQIICVHFFNISVTILEFKLFEHFILVVCF